MLQLRCFSKGKPRIGPQGRIQVQVYLITGDLRERCDIWGGEVGDPAPNLAISDTVVLSPLYCQCLTHGDSNPQTTLGLVSLLV